MLTVNIPAVTIEKLTKALKVIAEYSADADPDSREKAKAMFHVVRMVAEHALEEEQNG